MKAVISYSGGLDSAVLLYQYQKDIKYAISFNYGSKHNEREFKAAIKNCDRLGIGLIRVELLEVFKYFKSDLLLSGGEIPKGHYQDESMKKIVVPFRNGIMLSICAGIAESNECDTILIANHSGDHAIYPDCRPEFIKSMFEAVRTGTWNGIEIAAPFTHLTKREIAILGREGGVDFSDTYSCYEGREKHCGTCGACVERKEALFGFDNTNYE